MLPRTAGSPATAAVVPRADRRLAWPLVAGTAGSISILFGSSQAGSPFAEHSAGAWFFELGSSGHAGQRLAGVLVVYAGIILLLGAWLRVLRGARREQRPPLRRGDRAMLLAAWVAPLCVAPPLFSHDAYAYAASGQLLSRGLNPYLRAVAALGGGPFLAHVDRIWWHTFPPYGPGWERLVEGVVLASGHRLLGALVLLRLAALAALLVLAWAVPELAALTGHDPARAFAWGLLNPLVLLTLLGGMHNDTEMLALVATGLVVALRGHALLGTIACSLGAEVKVPALLAVVFIAWCCRPATGPDGEGLIGRLARVAGHLAVSAGVLAAVSVAAGLGWHWIAAGLTPGKVVSWLDPATALGLALSHLAAAVAGPAAGLGSHREAWLTAGRVAGVMVALGVAGVVLARSRDRSWPAGLGTALLALALLGPVVWPWYETWGIVLIATAAADTRRWQRGVLAGLSVLGCFADFPSAGVLTGGAPQFVVAAWVALAVCTLGYLALSVRFDGPGGPGADMLARRAGSSDPDQAAAGLPANGAGNQAAGPGTTLR